MPLKSLHVSTAFRSALRLGLVLLTSSLAAVATASVAVAQAPTAERANPPVFFAQDRSDIAPDPGATYGRLANGMTYVLYRNATPPGAASVWMRIGAGSMMERDDQQGLAHFLEHMAFNGSTNVPENEMVRLLERDGLKFGPDTNAYTSQTETVYMLNLPRAEASVVDTALFLMRETAGNLSLDPAAIDRERGVVLGEERSRASAGMRAQMAWLAAAFPGQKYAERMPIGQTGIIEHAPPQALRDFYRDFYRPEYATLIVVGDIDVAAVEAGIRARFFDWSPGPQSPAALTDFGTYADKGTLAHTYVEPGLPDAMSLMWAKPFEAEIETYRTDFDDTVEAIAIGILNERFARQAVDPATAFLGAGFYAQDIPETAQIYSLGINAKPDQEPLAFDQAVTALRQFLAYGISQDELDRSLTNLTRAYADSAASANTRPSTAIAGSIVSTLGTLQVLTSPAQNRDWFDTVKPRMTLSTVNAAIAAIVLGDGPILSRQGEDVADFDKAAMLEAWRAVMAAPVTAPAARIAETWPYTDFGTPGAVASRTSVDDLGFSTTTFSNGVTMNFKRTAFVDNQVLVRVRFAGGVLQVTPDQADVMKVAARFGIDDGGLGRLKAEDIGDALSGKSYSMSFYIADDETVLSGATTPTDFATQMQLLMAFATDAAFRPEAMQRFHAALPNAYASIRATPEAVFGTKAGEILYSGDRRYTFLDLDQALAIDNDRVRDFVQSIFRTAPVEVTVLGDIDEAEALAQVAATFATLSPRPATLAPVPGARDVRFPTADLTHVLTHEGRADQSLSVFAFPTTDFYADTRASAGLELLSSIMTLRLTEEVREKQGASYGASARLSASSLYPGFGYIGASSTIRPEFEQAFVDAVSAIVDDLKAKPVDEDELLRARRPLLDKLVNDRNTNGYWFQLLDGASTDARRLDLARRREAELTSITPDDIQALARTWLDMARAVHVQVKAADPVTAP